MSKVIIDCDIGSDDAWAVISLLSGEKISNYQVAAITCVAGNTDTINATRNALKVLEVCNRKEVPVFSGAKSNLIFNPNLKAEFHGIDGLNDVVCERPEITEARKEHAVEAMREIIENVS
jgi:inosine-uridine nucleoside N-ribohydrolase